MTILEILPQFLKGEKIRRDSWDKNAYIYKDGVYFHSVYNNNGTKGDDIRYLSEKIFALDDLMGNDWHNVLTKPKFKVGDWIVNNEDKSIGQITEILYDKEDSDLYGYKHTNGYFANAFENDYHIWTIEDAKDGDILYFNDDTIVIFKDLYNSSTFHSYCHIEDGVFDISKDEMPDWWEGKGFKPATKEQRDLLFAKMKEAGYVWDSEKKELHERK